MFSELLRSVVSSTMKAIGSPSKFLGVCEASKRGGQRRQLKWAGRNSDDLAINKLTRGVGHNEIHSAVGIV